MAKMDLDSLSIEQLAALREQATDKLMEKVAARQAELAAELDRLSHFGKQLKKMPAAKDRKTDGNKKRESGDPAAQAA
jgi:DNA-binding protein H-NS